MSYHRGVNGVNNPNVKRPDLFFGEGHWDWNFLNSCFAGTKIRLQDIDGHVEYRGYHLFIEAKLPNVKVKQAQEIVHRTLQAQKVNTVLVVWGRPQEAEYARLYTMTGMVFEGPISQVDFAMIVQAWFDGAKKKPRAVIPRNTKPQPIDPVLERIRKTFEDKDNAST